MYSALQAQHAAAAAKQQRHRTSQPRTKQVHEITVIAGNEEAGRAKAMLEAVAKQARLSAIDQSPVRSSWMRLIEAERGSNHRLQALVRISNEQDLIGIDISRS